MSVYLVDKREKSVVIFLSDGFVMRGVVFLNASTDSPSGGQTVADLLDEKAGFFPLRTESGSFCAVNKANISHLRYEPDDNERETTPAGDVSDVLISIAGGEQLRGQVATALPAGPHRLFDFISATSGFILLHSGKAHYLVNTALIRDISPG